MSFTSEEAFEQLAELQSGIAAVSLGAVAARDQIRALEEEALANFSQLDISDSDLFAALKTTFVKNIRQLEVLAPMMVAFERVSKELEDWTQEHMAELNAGDPNFKEMFRNRCDALRSNLDELHCCFEEYRAEIVRSLDAVYEEHRSSSRVDSNA